MFLLILESIGTSELILIGIIALIVFGPRKLPQMAKTIGKTMADFRRTTNEFKSTWEREAEFYKEELIISEEVSTVTGNSVITERTISKTISNDRTATEKPEIKEVEQEKLSQLFSNLKNQPAVEQKTEENQTNNFGESDKRNWL